MSDLEKMPPAADMRYDDEDADVVARVLVRVEWKGGKVREYEAEDPQAFKINDPETDMTITSMGMTAQAFGQRVPMAAMVPSLRLSFQGNPRRAMHIRTEATASPARRDARDFAEDQRHTVRLGKDAITGGGDGEVHVDPAMPEAGIDLAEDAPGLL